MTFLWYIPNQVDPGHRGDDTVEGHNGLERLTDLAQVAEGHGWGGALLGTGWGRPDTFTVAAALAARTTAFQPLIAIRPGYWRPAHFASAASTLDQLTGGRVLINIVSGQDNLAAYGDSEGDQPQRYARTKEFLQLVRRLWTEADVQLFWGEPFDGIAERISKLRQLEAELGREHPPLEFGLRITTLVRDTTEKAWADAEAKVAKMAEAQGGSRDRRWFKAVGQQRLLDLAERGDVLDDNLYTAPGKYGGGGAGTTWLVGSAEDVAKSLRKYQDLGITHFVLSDTPYREETIRVGDQ